MCTVLAAFQGCAVRGGTGAPSAAIWAERRCTQGPCLCQPGNRQLAYLFAERLVVQGLLATLGFKISPPFEFGVRILSSSASLFSFIALL